MEELITEIILPSLEIAISLSLGTPVPIILPSQPVNISGAESNAVSFNLAAVGIYFPLPYKASFKSIRCLR